MILLEKTSKLLQKVAVSGGGRCNLMHHEFSIPKLLKHYPRGNKALRKPFARFGPEETLEWFQQQGVEVKTEADGRMFPVTDSSQTVVDALLNAARAAGVGIRTKADVLQLEPLPEGFRLHLRKDEPLMADQVIVASGGSPKLSGLQWLAELGHTIVPPVPSLFTFNLPGHPVRELMGVSVERARVAISGTKLVEEGPLLITHWGLSGPAVLRLSAWGARLLAERNYHFDIRIRWVPELNEEQVRHELDEHRQQHPKQQVSTRPLFGLPKRLWAYHLQQVEMPEGQLWATVPKKPLNKLVQALVHDQYVVKGRTTFKEEFVTAGGVALEEVDFRTMESRKVPGLYFAGEVLDVDAVTGGFNFQAAWSTGFVAGTSAAGEVAGGCNLRFYSR